MANKDENKDDWKYICSFCAKKDNDENMKDIWTAVGAPWTGARICESCITRIYAELVVQKGDQGSLH